MKVRILVRMLFQWFKQDIMSLLANKWKTKVIHPYNGILFSHKKK